MSREWLGQNEGLTGIPWNQTTLCSAAPLRQRFKYFSIAILKGFVLSNAIFLSAQLWKDPRVH